MDLSIKDFDWRKLLVKHYKAYGLDEKSLAVILCLDDVLSSIEAVVSADDLVPYMTLSADEIDGILVSLLNKKFIEYAHQGPKMVTTLEPLKDKIFSDLKKDIAIEANEALRKPGKATIDSLYRYFEDVLGRTLTGKEVDRISFWIRSGSGEDLIKEAVEKLRAQNKAVSLTAVDKILLALRKSEDRTKEGFSPLDGDWKQADKEATDFLSKPWVPEDK